MYFIAHQVLPMQGIPPALSYTNYGMANHPTHIASKQPQLVDVDRGTVQAHCYHG
jgi:hypothetical protein